MGWWLEIVEQGLEWALSPSEANQCEDQWMDGFHQGYDQHMANDHLHEDHGTDWSHDVFGVDPMHDDGFHIG